MLSSMKKIFTFFFLLFCKILFAQVNLVPNPSFEDTVQCPNSGNQVGKCAQWFNFGNSPDYFNACGSGGAGVPNTWFGYCLPHSGNAFCGAILYNGTFDTSWVEYLGTQLTQPLQQGQKYFISFYVKKVSQIAYDMACNKIGIKFSNTLYSEFNPPPKTNYADFYTDSIITDSLSWKQLKGSFIADTSYQYLIIGNFFYHNSTDTMHFGPLGNLAYYVIDDICVSTDSTLCYSTTGIEEINLSSFSISVNPIDEFFVLNLSNFKNSQLLIYQSSGKLVFNKKISNKNFFVNTSSYSDGIYCLQILSNNKIISKKILIIHN